MTNFALLLFSDVEELDFVGPWEVFTASSMIRERSGQPPDQVFTVAESTDVLKCAKGLRVIPDHTLEQHPDVDVLLVPGGQGTRTQIKNDKLLEWIRRIGSSATWTTSVCTGALLLHRSGVAKGKRMATHFLAEDLLEGFGDVTVVRDQRWVVDGKVVSSQGVSAGIDMALWVLGQVHGIEHARTTQKHIQYDPAPPYAENDSD